MKRAAALLLIGAIRAYQHTLSPDHGPIRHLRSSPVQVCTYYPTCSEYAIAVIEKYGPFHGSFLSVRRILSCHPWQKKHVDIP